MYCPIKNQINTIFVHVSDLKESVKWYSKLLGHEYNLDEVSRPVYNLKINHYTGLTLDAGPEGINKPASTTRYPLFNFHTEEIENSYEYVKQLNYKIESEIVRYPDFAYFTISDPDQNVIMICTG